MVAPVDTRQCTSASFHVGLSSCLIFSFNNGLLTNVQRVFVRSCLMVFPVGSPTRVLSIPYRFTPHRPSHHINSLWSYLMCSVVFKSFSGLEWNAHRYKELSGYVKNPQTSAFYFRKEFAALNQDILKVRTKTKNKHKDGDWLLLSVLSALVFTLHVQK